MRSLTLEDLKTLALSALVPFALLFVLDGLAPEPVRGVIVEEFENSNRLWATIEWTDEEGKLVTANVRLPEKYSGATHVPVLASSASSASVGDGHLPDVLYLAVAIGGLLLGAYGLALRRKPAKEAMIKIPHWPGP